MVHDRKWKGFALCGTVALAVVGLALTASADIKSGTVFSTHADGNGGPSIMMLEKDKDPVEFATVDPGTDRVWLAPLGLGPDKHLYLALATKNGTLLDVTDGGDRSTTKPVATGIFPVLPRKFGAMVFDAEGNAYLSMNQVQGESDNAPNGDTYPIMRVELKTGKVSALKGSFNHAAGLAIRPNADKQEILYIAEGVTGRVLTYNLTTDTPGDKPLATGFPSIPDHGFIQLAFDQSGKLFASWRTDPDDKYSVGLFDITNGLEFKDVTSTPPVLMMPDIPADINGLVFDASNNLLAGGDNTNYVWMSPFDASTGKWGDFVQFTSSDLGGGDAETVFIVP